MKAMFESVEFRDELPGWALRGAFCGATSAGWAWLMGFQSPAEIAGMAAGVGFWVTVFTVLCAARIQLADWNHRQAVAALKWAAWIKIGFTACGWLLFAAAGLLNFEDLSQLGILGMVDTLLGLAALALVSFVAGMKGPEMLAAADSFGWTALTTIIEGALMAAMIGAIALMVLGWWRWGSRFLLQVKAKLSPVQTVD